MAIKISVVLVFWLCGPLCTLRFVKQEFDQHRKRDSESMCLSLVQFIETRTGVHDSLTWSLSKRVFATNQMIDQMVLSNSRFVFVLSDVGMEAWWTIHEQQGQAGEGQTLKIFKYSIKYIGRFRSPRSESK